MPSRQPRSSGLDFSDGKMPSLEQHPDVALPNSQPSHLQRNKTERRRLQGLQRSNTTTGAKVQPYVPRTWQEKWDLWMINEGGRRIFFFVWILLHVLVAVLGAMHYDLKDNLTGARATFGVTFSESSHMLPTSNILTIHVSYCPYCCSRSARRCNFYSAARLS